MPSGLTSVGSSKVKALCQKFEPALLSATTQGKQLTLQPCTQQAALLLKPAAQIVPHKALDQYKLSAENLLKFDLQRIKTGQRSLQNRQNRLETAIRKKIGINNRRMALKQSGSADSTENQELARALRTLEQKIEDRESKIEALKRIQEQETTRCQQRLGRPIRPSAAPVLTNISNALAQKPETKAISGPKPKIAPKPLMLPLLTPEEIDKKISQHNKKPLPPRPTPNGKANVANHRRSVTPKKKVRFADDEGGSLVMTRKIPSRLPPKP